MREEAGHAHPPSPTTPPPDLPTPAPLSSAPPHHLIARRLRHAKYKHSSRAKKFGTREKVRRKTLAVRPAGLPNRSMIRKIIVKHDYIMFGLCGRDVEGRRLERGRSDNRCTNCAQR